MLAHIMGIIAAGRRLGGSGGGSAFPLDAHSTGVSVAYSTKRLFTSYTGPAMRVRNDAGSELDIGFTGAGLLDTTALTTHVGSGDGRVVTWYDQGPSAVNLSRTTVSEQPRIVVAGSFNNYVQFDGTDDTLTTSTGVAAAAAKSIYYKGTPFTVNPNTGTPVCWQITGTTPLIMSFNWGAMRSQPINQAGALQYSDAPMNSDVRAFIVDSAVSNFFAEQVLFRKSAGTFVNFAGNVTATANPVGGGVITMGGIPGQSNYGASHFNSFVVYDAAHSVATADTINALLDF